MVEEVFHLAVTLGKIEEGDREGLMTLCEVVVAGILARLRDGVRVEDCFSTLALGGAWLVLAQVAMEGASDDVESFTAGSLTIKKGSASSGERSVWLTRHGESLLAPYVKEGGFACMGVKG